MVDVTYIFFILQTSFLIVAFCLSFAYVITILCIPRFHQQNNMFILNICCSIIRISIYFIIYFLMGHFDPEDLFTPNLCTLLFYAYSLAIITVPFAFVTFSIHRFCSIVYHTQGFFKTKKWIIVCITSQWIMELIFSLPYVFRNESYCINPLWLSIYSFIIVIIMPISMNIVFNTLIFAHVRSSTRRVQPHIARNTENDNNNQQQRQIGRREIALLKQMIFMFTMFIVGWGPTFLFVIVGSFININTIVSNCITLLCEVSLLSLTINLFMCNHELRQYLANKIRLLFMH